MSRRAVFLDRDGVINRSFVREGKPFAPTRAADVEILPGVADALQRVRAAGFLSIVVTNQPEIGRGTLPPAELDAMHKSMAATLAIDAFYVCTHDDSADCACRKPKPGMLLQAAREHSIDLAGSFMVGDRWRDVDAGRAAGCKTVWVNRGYRERTPQAPDYEADGLPAAVDWILRQNG